MRWSLTLGRVRGIPVNVHLTFVLLPAWLLFEGLARGLGLSQALGTVVFTAAVFGTVVLHELGHALTALRFGIRTRDITLWPIGGVARHVAKPLGLVHPRPHTCLRPCVDSDRLGVGATVAAANRQKCLSETEQTPIFYVELKTEPWRPFRKGRMETVPLLESRRNAEKTIRWWRQGTRMVMTHRSAHTVPGLHLPR